jgi:hypothetical protein
LLVFRFGLTAHSPSLRISRRMRRRPTETPSRKSWRNSSASMGSFFDHDSRNEVIALR